MTTTERKWFERVRAWRESGLSAQEFCTGRDFAANTLRQWPSLLKRRGLAGSPPRTTEIRVARVERSPLAVAPGTLTVEVSGARVSVPSGSDAATVRTVLEALRDCTAGGS